MKNNQYIRQAQHKKGFANIILIGVVVALVAIGGYFVLKTKQQSIVQQIPINSVNEIANWKTYINTQYGFDLTFTDAWKGYKVFSSEGSQGVGAPDYIDFSMPTIDKTQCVQNVTDEVCGYTPIIEITIIAKDRKYEGTGVKIGQNNNAVYYYTANSDFPNTINNYFPNDLKRINFEISKVISTFKFTK